MTARELDDYIVSYLAGQEDAFDVIYEETQKTVFLSIFNIIKDRNLVEDIMQDTYLKAINSIESYRLGTNFKAWIATIARNQAINVYNKRKREVLIDPVDNIVFFESPVENNSLLDKALKVLDGQEKDIIIYHIVLNFKFKDIADVLDMPLSTVFFIYKKALAKIKKEV
ncbi:MAG TPA: sigma-70 family RNA polymerase sigma factor [Bacilli bacterium]|nr:sigma-70 family RNA polymerase sigma factor [Bacilli bacterium]